MQEVAVKFVRAHKVVESYSWVGHHMTPFMGPAPKGICEVYLDLARAEARKIELDGQTGSYGSYVRSVRLDPEILAVSADGGVTVTLLSQLNTHRVHTAEVLN